ncbi:serine/threonine-protein kinase [Rhodohalobacter sulfatireducens]|uniref:Serine/threonine-protein kinase n=1 Tax=Rhodohalobacter sulfatireducens TaxID=2911366 RepID=A0ABS9KID5_9BACT|nr:serine/threonine-protein kinase [Rhodohalobacter sulfatireducens]MCG2590596.1 serine/threonine-protein kinase [Rhodohalobacter sulfatireducens]
MQTEQWKLIEGHFHKALDLPPTERKRYIQRIAETDPALSSSVEDLLRSHFDSEDFLERSIFDDVISLPNERIGAWKILRQIGKGGMSTVYLAERADGIFSRNVAVKFLHGFAPGRKMHARMRTEQKILASLNHRNICRLLDAGIHENGRPYFIMEYIEGLPIDEWCTSRKLSIQQRLDLFTQVCDAVSYAHQRLIVHRDIKPSNILVNNEGEVKLLDFGIAKIIGAEQGESTKTKTGNELLTPEFASPEQFQGREVTTATDVYALGQLLYLLLTDTLPFNFKEKSSYEIGKTITESESEKPSKKVTQLSTKDSSRVTSLAHLTDRQAVHQLQGDLDNIITKALRKDPLRRYQSAEHFKNDIINYIENKPVSARPESFTYLAKKFVQRHKAPVVSALAATFLLISLTLFSFRQADEANSQRLIAEQRSQDVRQLAHSLIFDLHDSIANLPGSTPARELIIEEALNYLDGLAQTENAGHGLLLDLAEAYRKVGDVQGNPTNNNLGKHREAITSYQKGLEFVRTVLQEEPMQLRARQTMANIYEKTGDVQAVLGNIDTARENKIDSNAIYKTLADEFPDDPNRQFAYSISLIKLGDLTGNPNFSNLNELEEALQLYESAEEILLPVYSREPEDTDYIKYMGIIYERMGTIYETEQQLEEAIRCFEKSMELRKELVRKEPLNTEAVRDEAIAHEKMGDVYKHSEELDKSLDHYRNAHRLFKWLADADPQNSQAQQSLAISHIHLGDLFFHPEQPSFGDTLQSREHFNLSNEILLNLNQQDSSNNRVDFLMNLIDRRLQAM